MLTKQEALEAVEFIAQNWDERPDCRPLAEYISNTQRVTHANMGQLDFLFGLQKNLQRRIHGVDLPALMPNKIPITVTSIVAELGEILEDEQHWKDWRHDFPETDRTHLLMEVADLWHFVINLTLYLGFDSQDVGEEFIAKNKENHSRQDRGY